ncbi:esterase/lipase family protein [Moraxella atlantae]|uniref:esterase/lipase family protein n=1 Tax=Faucicola atlantae TaxID=34059 RepID=UPI003751F604
MNVNTFAFHLILDKQSSKQPLTLMPCRLNRLWRLGLGMLGAVSLLSLAACQTIPVGKRSTAQAIMAQRADVLTSQRLSNDTQSRLLGAGLQADDCLADMPRCIVSLQKANFSNDKSLYGAYSELFYSAALRFKDGYRCSPSPRELATDYAKQYVSDTPPPPDPKTGERPIDCQAALEDSMLQAVRFAYIYLMYDWIQKPKHIDNSPNTNTDLETSLTAASRGSQTIYPPHERDVQIKDIYNAALDELGDRLYENRFKPSYQVNDNRIQINLGQVSTEKAHSPTRLVSSNQINLSKFNSISRRDGFGVDYVMILDDRYTVSVRNQILNSQRNNLSLQERIHTLGHLPVTLLLIPQGNDLDTLLKTHDFTLSIYDPFETQRTTVLGQTVALSANFSAAYGMWLSDNSLSPISKLNMLSKNFQTTQPHVFMLEPYDPNKRVIIMLHGLASSPETWISLTNDIFNDPTLRDNYQVWQVFYPTNLPILENRYQIAELLQAAFKQVDPTGSAPASQHAVLIGHSLGGVIGRMLVSNDDLRPHLRDLINQNPSAPDAYAMRQLEQTVTSRDAFNDRFILHAMPQVDRAIFINAPFRGTDFADRWFARALRRLIHLPAGFLQTVSQNLTSIFTEGELANNPLAGLFLQNGASQLSDQSFFVQLTKNLRVTPRVTTNVLIGANDKDLLNALQQSKAAADSPTVTFYNSANLQAAQARLDENQQLLQQVKTEVTGDISDGVVPYSSSHLDGAESEKIFSGKHDIHTDPQAILELRRILRRQLREYPTPNKTMNKAASKI